MNRLYSRNGKTPRRIRDQNLVPSMLMRFISSKKIWILEFIEKGFIYRIKRITLFFLLLYLISFSIIFIIIGNNITKSQINWLTIISLFYPSIYLGLELLFYLKIFPKYINFIKYIGYPLVFIIFMIGIFYPFENTNK